MEEGCCAVCGHEGPFRCRACCAVRYCSRAHQISHWKQHKLKCQTYKEEWDHENGHHLVASRDLEPGEIILLEDPFVLCPLPGNGGVVCVGCCRYLKEPGVGCPQCNWPMCGRPECWGEGSQHALGECSKLEIAGRSLIQHVASLSSSEVVYVCIMILRCLSLKERDPVKFEQMSEFETFGSKHLKGLENPNSVNIAMKLLDQWSIHVPKELIVNLSCIFKSHCSVIPKAFEMPSDNSFTNLENSDVDVICESEDESFDVFHALYPMVKKIGHCCVSNTTVMFTKLMRIVVRATVKITKGSKIFINHTNPLFSTIKRQNRLNKIGITCRCDRCKDPTELGTFLTGIYCPQCPIREGILLAEDPFNKDADWVCNKVAVHRQTCSFISSLLEIVKSNLKDLHDPAEFVSDWEVFIDRFEKIIHPNHFLMTRVKMALCLRYGNLEDDTIPITLDPLPEWPFGQCDPRPEEDKDNDEILNADIMKSDVIKKKESLSLELLKLVDSLSPGLNLLRGLLLDECVKIMVSRMGESHVSTPKEGRDDRFFGEFDALTKVMHKRAKEVYTIFSWEQEMSPPGFRAKKMKKSVEQFDLIETLMDGMKLQGDAAEGQL